MALYHMVSITKLKIQFISTERTVAHLRSSLSCRYRFTSISALVDPDTTSHERDSDSFNPVDYISLSLPLISGYTLADGETGHTYKHKRATMWVLHLMYGNHDPEMYTILVILICILQNILF